PLNQPRQVVGDYVRIVHAENTGAAFGLLPERTTLLSILSVLAVVAIVYYYRQIASSSWLVSATLGMQLGGAAGNLVDRVREGRVRVDGESVEPAYKVRVGQELTVDVPDAAPALSLAAEDIPVDVLYEDEDVIVVNKPAGLVVHPAYGHETGTLVNAIVGRITGDTGRAASRPGIVHRLDKDTSGVLIVAKTDVAHLALARQLQALTFAKEYLGLVWGDPREQPVVVEAPLLRDPDDR